LAESGNFTIESFEVERELIKCVWVISKFPKISFRNLATFPGGAQAFRMCFFARIESLGGTNENEAGFELAPDETEVRVAREGANDVEPILHRHFFGGG
jgi:hypothetical protein